MMPYLIIAWCIGALLVAGLALDDLFACARWRDAACLLVAIVVFAPTWPFWLPVAYWTRRRGRAIRARPQAATKTREGHLPCNRKLKT